MYFIPHTEENATHEKALGYSTLYLLPSPHLNLLEQRVENLLQYNNPKFILRSNGLFTYTEFVDNTNSIKRLQLNKKLNTDTSKECWLLRAIEALDLHWS